VVAFEVQRTSNLRSEQDSYTKTDFRVIWNSANRQIAAEAFVENIEDEEVLARTNVGGFDLVQSSYLYPRTYGVKFSYNF
jgi:outer membrane receptor protein involved in Fe transport